MIPFLLQVLCFHQLCRSIAWDKRSKLGCICNVFLWNSTSAPCFCHTEFTWRPRDEHEQHMTAGWGRSHKQPPKHWNNSPQRWATRSVALRAEVSEGSTGGGGTSTFAAKIKAIAGTGMQIVTPDASRRFCTILKGRMRIRRRGEATHCGSHAGVCDEG